MKLRESRVEGSARWAVMVRRDIPDMLTDDVLLTRWRLIATPWGSIYLHRLLIDDDARTLHDHPWSFASLVLWGGYDETWAEDLDAAQNETQLLGGLLQYLGVVCDRTWRAGSIHRIRRGEFHQIRRLHRTPTWTLLFVGPRRGTWGYATETGWVRFDEYHRQRRAEAGLSGTTEAMR